MQLLNTLMHIHVALSFDHHHAAYQLLDSKCSSFHISNEKQFSVCVTDNNDVYVSDVNNSSISRLSPSGSVSPVFSTAPLKPVGICQTKDVGLLITLRDTESDTYQPNSDSQRLVRHVTLVRPGCLQYQRVLLRTVTLIYV